MLSHPPFFSPSVSLFAVNADLDVVIIPEQVPLDKIPSLQVRGIHSEEHRRRRSVPLQPEEEAEVLIVRLPAGLGSDPGSDIYLNLRRNGQFLAPGFSVEEIGVGRSSRRVDLDRLCFYTGHVLNRSADSFASLSACGGLVLVSGRICPRWAQSGVAGGRCLGKKSLWKSVLGGAWS